MSGNLGTVVVAADGSEASMTALKWAINNLKLNSQSGSFIILHVQSPPSISAGISPDPIPFGGPRDVEVPAITAAIEAHQIRITEAVLDHALQICAELRVNANVKTQVIIGDPKEKICEVVEDLHADMLVIGCRSSGAIKRMFLGSVSNYCMNHAHCPVTIIRDTP